MYQKLKTFFLQSARVWRVLKKPSYEEFKTVSKISALGILIIGFVGFLISLVMRLLV